MKHISVRSFLLYILPAVVVFFILGGIAIYQSGKISTITKRLDSLTTELASTTYALSQNTEMLSKSFNALSKETAGISVNLSKTQQNVNTVKSQVGGVEQTVGNISGTVGTLQKLAQVDRELLKKYSKVYFMNDNYVPAHLTLLPGEYTYSSARQEQFLSEAWPSLKNLFDTAKKDGVTLYTKSAYRSFAEQKSLKSAYSVIYG